MDEFQCWFQDETVAEHVFAVNASRAAERYAERRERTGYVWVRRHEYSVDSPSIRFHVMTRTVKAYIAHISEVPE